MKNFIESSNALALRFGAGIKPKSSEDWNATTGSSVTLAFFDSGIGGLSVLHHAMKILKEPSKT